MLVAEKLKKEERPVEEYLVRNIERTWAGVHSDADQCEHEAAKTAEPAGDNWREVREGREAMVSTVLYCTVLYRGGQGGRYFNIVVYYTVVHYS